MIAEIENLAEPLLASEGIALVDVEYLIERNSRILRIIIDKKEGVTLEDCANVSSQLGDLLDAKLEVVGPYNMEVSSPGLDRPLTKQKHFEYFKGRKVFIKTITPVTGALDLRGLLMGMSDGVVTLKAKDQDVMIPYDDIQEARLDD